jgi:HD-GYP domain-containing protein (c-di-GMP phosphodiesterase class II)
MSGNSKSASSVFRQRGSIAVRLTFYFALFGILIGLAGYLLLGITSSNQFIKNIHSLTSELLRELEIKENGEWADLVGENGDKFLAGKEMIHGFTSNYHIVSGFAIYYKNETSGGWNTLYIDEQNTFKSRIADINPSLLENALKKRIFTTSTIFTPDDRVRIFFNITQPENRNHYVIFIEANKSEFRTFIKNTVPSLLVYLIFIVLISIFLGKMFARKIARPIKKLSKSAMDIASSAQPSRFRISRKDELGTLAFSLNKMQDSIEGHVYEIEHQMRSLETMNKIDKTVLSSTSKKDLLDRVVELVSEFFIGKSIAIVVKRDNEEGHEILSYSPGVQSGVLIKPPLDVSEFLGKKFFEEITTMHIHRRGEIHATVWHRLEELLISSLGVILNIPIFISNHYAGSILLGTLPGTEFTDKDIETARMLADQVGVALQSLRSLEEKEKILLGILLALTRSIDAKSKWTSGHSERVAKFSEQLGIKLEMDGEDIRVLSISALLHDIGKIGIPETILDKPAKLSDEEYSLIKLHPSKGAEIVSDIVSYETILPGILYHHEQWSGGGYPEGRREEDIPDLARIIAITDVFDAITADRPYRSGMDSSSSLAFMEENSRRMFDPDLIKTFLDLLKKE